MTPGCGAWRPALVGDPSLSRPTTDAWRGAAAFAVPQNADGTSTAPSVVGYYPDDGEGPALSLSKGRPLSRAISEEAKMAPERQRAASAQLSSPAVE